VTEEQESVSEETVVKTPEEELQEYKGKYLMLLADVDNTRKRMQKERQEMAKFTVENLLLEILEPIDNLENALQFTGQMSEETRNWAYGFNMILGQFKEVLSNHGISSLQSEGKKFDPELHYAIETEETSAQPPGTVLKEFVKGYRSKERTIRHARVRVSVAPGTTKNQDLEEKQ
jgi:molecular chaperone GrpE